MEGPDVRETLFDEQWYRNGGPGFAGDAYEHFATVGWRENRNPHPLFDVAFYKEQAPDLDAGDVDPITHYLEMGAAAGLDPHALFDTSFYVGRYGDALDDTNPFVHYLVSGWRHGWDPNLFFVSSFYLERSPDVVQIGMNPLIHYAAFGGRELHRRPHPLFDAEAYALRRGLTKPNNPLVDFLRRAKAASSTAPSGFAERPEVSAIILNLNKSLLTLQCVVDLIDDTRSVPCEIVVVDNGSHPDDFAQLVIGLPHWVKIVRLSTNRYFGEGNNIGVEASRGRLLLFLNNDAFVNNDAVSSLTRVLDRHPDAGAVGPKFIYPDGRLQECGALISSCGTVTQRGKFLGDQPGRFAVTQPVDYVSAACVLMPRALFDEVGGFDLTWDPAYYEDVDLCLKLELIGKRTYYCADAVVTHIENATSSDASHGLRLNTVVQINREKFISRWGPYIESRHNIAASRVALPPKLVDVQPPFAETAVLYTPYALVPGGGERYLLTIAQLLSQHYRTFVITPERYSTYRQRTLAAELDIDLSRVRFEPLSSLSRFTDCELFIAMGNEVLPPRTAIGRRRIFVCQFPFPMHPNHIADAWGWLENYEDVVVYSEFAARHFAERARAVAARVPRVTVLPPSCPMYDDAGTAVRVPGRILNVGRFHPGGHCKRQDTIVDAFRELVERSGRMDLELHLLGTVSADPASRDFYLKVLRRAQGLPVYFHLNAAPNTVRDLYASSSFYWHATGYGQSTTLLPERMEHFGISVVEAMSSGAIPLVYAEGGPTEIVANGVTGFHWRTIDELVEHNRRLLDQPSNASDAMRDRAREAARGYDAAAFADRLETFLRPGSATVPRPFQLAARTGVLAT